MSTRSERLCRRFSPLVAALCLALTSCGGGSSSTAATSPTTPAGSSSPTAPSPPTAPPADPQATLQSAIRRLDRHRQILTSADLDYGSVFEVVTKGRYEPRSGRYDGTLELLGQNSRSQSEVFHGSGTTLARTLQGGETCWWRAAGGDGESYAAGVPPQLAILRGARAVSGSGTNLHGSVLAAPLFLMIGSPETLRRQHFTAAPGTRVQGQFLLQDGQLTEFRTTATRAFRAVGQVFNEPPNGADTWSVTFSSEAAAPIAVPSPAQVVAVDDDDPQRASLVAACTARIR